MTLIEKVIVQPWQWVLSHKLAALAIAVLAFVIGAAVVAKLLDLLPAALAKFLAGALWILPLVTFWSPPISLFLAVAVLAVKFNIQPANA